MQTKFNTISVEEASRTDLSHEEKLVRVAQYIDGVLGKAFADPELSTWGIDSEDLPFKVHHTTLSFGELMQSYRRGGWTVVARGTPLNYRIEFTRKRP